jgi:hypothetical protein
LLLAVMQVSGRSDASICDCISLLYVLLMRTPPSQARTICTHCIGEAAVICVCSLLILIITTF